MAFVCRSCARQAHSPLPNGASLTLSRHFSLTPSPRSHRLPDFPSVSPTLDPLLSTLRDTHIMPLFLTPDQKRLVYRAKHRSALLNNPSTVTVSDTEFDLRPLSRNELAAARSGAVGSAIAGLAEEDAWAALPGMLDALAALGNRVPKTHAARLVRLAGTRGKFGPVAQAIRGREWRRMVAGNEALRMAVVRGPRQVAEAGGWSREAVNKAVRTAEDVKISLQEAGVGVGDLLGVAGWVELSAVDARVHGGDKEVLRMYYERLRDIFSPETVPRVEELERNVDGGFMRVLPLWQGVVLAEKVLGVSGGDLGMFAARCGSELEGAVRELKKGEVKEGSYAQLAIREYEIAQKHIEA